MAGGVRTAGQTGLHAASDSRLPPVSLDEIQPQWMKRDASPALKPRTT